MSDIKEAIAKAPSGRTKRVPIGTRNILTVTGKDPDYVYRIINDSGDRVQKFLEAGYELVSKNSTSVGDKRINAPSAEGSVQQVSVGGGQKGFVVRIRKEWYDEDQAAKLANLKALEESTKAKALDGTYGKLEITRD